LIYRDILIKLRKIIRSINIESKKVEKQMGISIPQLLTLQYLDEQDDYKDTSKNIKSHLNLNASTVSGIISRLESKGLVARLPNPVDKRGSYITLTAKASELLTKAPTTLQEKLTLRLKDLGEDQIIALNENIDLLIRIMDAVDIDAAPMITDSELKAKNS